MASISNNGRVFWTTAVAVIVLDVASKALAVKHLLPHLPKRIVGDVARFTLAYNPGAAFSMSLGQYSRLIFGAFAAVALVILYRIYRSSSQAHPSGDLMRILALGLAWGGAAGNLIDRFRSDRPGVVDFIDIGVGDVRFWTFNVADSAVTIGALLLAWILWKDDRAAHAAAAVKAGTQGSKARDRERV
jgi:signal peptidase II